jgi:hypothetical protein
MEEHPAYIFHKRRMLRRGEEEKEEEQAGEGIDHTLDGTQVWRSVCVCFDLAR